MAMKKCVRLVWPPMVMAGLRNSTTGDVPRVYAPLAWSLTSTNVDTACVRGTASCCWKLRPQATTVPLAVTPSE